MSHNPMNDPLHSPDWYKQKASEQPEHQVAPGWYIVLENGVFTAQHHKFHHTWQRGAGDNVEAWLEALRSEYAQSPTDSETSEGTE